MATNKQYFKYQTTKREHQDIGERKLRDLNSHFGAKQLQDVATMDHYRTRLQILINDCTLESTTLQFTERRYTMSTLYSLLPILVFMCSCSFEQTTEDAVKIMQIALQNPEGAIDICAKIQAQSQKQECLFSSALQLQNSPTVREKICQELRNNERGECYFLLAEESNDPTLCPKAIPFENDCRLHIFSLRSGRYHSLSKLIELAKSLDMDINNNNVQALMYREALSRTPNVPISICEQANNSTSCIDVAKKLYRDILILAKKQKNFPCQPPLGRLDHGNHPTLLKEFKVFKQELCIQKP